MTKFTGRRLALTLATLCYLGGIGCAIGAALVHAKTANDPLRGALIATAAYSLLCGLLFHGIVKVVMRPRS